MRNIKYERQYERYDYLKKIHICTNCGNEEAEPNNIYCYECREKIYKRNAKYYKKNKEELNTKRKEYFKNLYHQRKEQGVCTKCGKRKVCKNSSILCIDCYIKHKKIKDKRWNNEIPRCERKYYDLCYICGKAKIYKSNLCKKHYNLAKNRMIELNKRPTLGMVIAREEYKKRFRELGNKIWMHKTKCGEKSLN